MGRDTQGLPMQFPKKNAQLTSAPLRASEGVSCWFTTLHFFFLTRSIQDHGMSDIQAVVDDLHKLVKRKGQAKRRARANGSKARGARGATGKTRC